jgi:hypothetical protein
MESPEIPGRFSRDRIFVVLDASHSASLPEQLVQMGLQVEDIVVWPRNGIEYYYPPLVVDRIFGAGGPLAVHADQVSRNGLTYTKNELAEKVCSLTDQATPLHHEFETLLVRKIAERIG